MKIAITPEALAQVLALPKAMRSRIDDVIVRLRNWPRGSGVKWLSGGWKNHARIRTGDY